MSPKSRFRLARGFSLVEILVVLAVLGLISMAISGSIVGIYKHGTGVSNKIATLDLQLLLTRYFSSDQYCSCLLNGLTFNTDSPALSADPTELPTSFGPAPSCTPSSDILVKEGMILSDTQLKVENLSVKNFENIGGDVFVAKLAVEFSTAEAVAPKPIESSFRFAIDSMAGSSSARPIMGCANSGVGGVKFGGMYSYHWYHHYCKTANPVTGACTCPAGFIAKKLIRNGLDDGSHHDDQDLFFCYSL